MPTAPGREFLIKGATLKPSELAAYFVVSGLRPPPR